MNSWSVLALAIVVILAGYAGWLLGRLWRQRQALRNLEIMRRQHSVDSLQVLARSVVAGQVNVSEAALRMAVLLDNLDVALQPPADVAAIHRLAECCRGFTLGEARLRLPGEERRRQDDQRQMLENRHGDAVREAAQRLLTVLPSWRSASR